MTALEDKGSVVKTKIMPQIHAPTIIKDFMYFHPFVMCNLIILNKVALYVSEPNLTEL